MLKGKEKEGREGSFSTLADPRDPRCRSPRGELGGEAPSGASPGAGPRLPYMPAPAPGAESVDVRRLLHWAIGHQRAHLAARARGAISEEFWVKAGGLDSARLCAVNGEAGGPVDCSPAWLRQVGGGGVDEDAAKVHDQVLACVRDWRVYNAIVEHAFDDSLPDWMPEPRCDLAPHRDARGRPVWETQAERTWRGVWRGRLRVREGRRYRWVEQEVVGVPPAEGWAFVCAVRGETVEHRYTPLYRPDDPEIVVAARRQYAGWWAALADVARALSADAGRPTGVSRWTRVTHGAPAHPWPEADDARLGAMAATVRFARLEALQQGWADPTVGRMTSGAPYRLT